MQAATLVKPLWEVRRLSEAQAFLDKVLSASNLLSALTVVASIIESSDVYGATGGFKVLATDGPVIPEKPVDMQENFLEFRFRIVILIILHIS